MSKEVNVYEFETLPEGKVIKVNGEIETASINGILVAAGIVHDMNRFFKVKSKQYS